MCSVSFCVILAALMPNSMEARILAASVLLSPKYFRPSKSVRNRPFNPSSCPANRVASECNRFFAFSLLFKITLNKSSVLTVVVP